MFAAMSTEYPNPCNVEDGTHKLSARQQQLHAPEKSMTYR